MYFKPVIWMAVLACLVFASGCNEADSTSPVAATEVELLISDPDTPPDEILTLIDFVSYRITCPNSGLTPYDDSVDLNGNFEVNQNANPPVWQLVTSLPLSTCTIALWVFQGDAIICSGSEVIPILDESDPAAPSKVNIELVCSLSANVPSGNVDIDGDFEFINGNYCPSLVWLGAVPVDIPPASAATTTLTTSAFDVDDGCGLNCDPQTCDFTQNPPVCSPGPDPGFSSTFVAPAGNGTFDDPVTIGSPVNTSTTYTCDPRYPGPTEICVVASDGDADCDQIRCITIHCPDICDGVVCEDDGDDCTREYCSPVDGQCFTDIAPAGIACSDCLGTCDDEGVCSGPAWTGTITGTAMSFVGTVQFVRETIANPYSGETVTLNRNLNVNTSSYQGTDGVDTLTGTTRGDFLLAQQPEGNQTICGVENIISQNSFDAIILADEFIQLGSMTIEGGNAPDVIWANVGNDIVRGNNGVDLLDGGPGDDVIEGGNGNDTITLWPGSGFDSIDGGDGTDTVRVDAIASQIEITTSDDGLYEFDILYRGAPLAKVRNVEVLELDDVTIDLTACAGGAQDVCGLCGNDALNGGEECDDGDNDDGDGCAADCTAEF
jgi:cysteine-rich repeat protein